MLLNGGELDGVRILARKTVDYMTADHMGPEIDATLLRLSEYQRLRLRTGRCGAPQRGHLGREQLAGRISLGGLDGHVLLVSIRRKISRSYSWRTRPGAIRYYHRQFCTRW